MGPPDSPCQHHVCRECVGGRMRLKPACGWCNDPSLFAENDILRTVVQCFKKLCQYLVGSASAAAGVDAGPLMAAIRDGMLVSDDYASPAGPELAVFAAKSPKASPSRAPKHERTAQNSDSSNRDKGQGRCRSGSGPLTNRERISPRKRKCAVQGVAPADDKQSVNNELSDKDKKAIGHGSESKVGRKRKRLSKACNRAKGKQQQQQQQQQQHCPNGIDQNSENILSRNSIYETVAAEHDYNRNSPPSITTSPVLKVRIRKIEGDHESLIRRPKLVAEAMFNPDAANNSLSTEENFSKTDSLGDISNNNDTFQGDLTITDQVKTKSSKKNISGCRCGMATPNPGKLTCCGQRCPCYSSFKGCVDCKCRGCRNPRGDRPSPHSLKVQLTSSHIPLTSPSPQLIFTPIKMDNNNIKI